MLLQPTPRVLIVDDDPAMLRWLTAAMQRAFSGRVEVRPETDPRAARGYLEAELVDLMITDLEMPGLDGLELLRCAKRRNAWTQILLVTGHSRPDALTDAMEQGATDYLLKPVIEADFHAVISGCIERLARWRNALAGTLAGR